MTTVAVLMVVVVWQRWMVQVPNLHRKGIAQVKKGEIFADQLWLLIGKLKIVFI